MAGIGWTREEAIQYLTHNENWRSLQRSNAQRAEDLSTATLKRYAGRLWTAQKTGEWLPDRAALRGHRISENKPKNRKRKPGQEDWEPPVKVARGTWLMDGPRHATVVRRVTGNQAQVVDFLSRMTRTRGRRGYRQVAFNIYGFRQGEYAQLMWKGGYHPRKLLEAADYYRTRTGRWARKQGGKGIQNYLLDLLAQLGKYPKRWKRIALYEIYAWDTPIQGVKDAGIVGRRKGRALRLSNR